MSPWVWVLVVSAVNGAFLFGVLRGAKWTAQQTAERERDRKAEEERWTKKPPPNA